MRAGVIAVAMLAALAAPAAAQAPSVIGTWRVASGVETKGGPREVIIRADSSASWGEETVRWRTRESRMWIAIGDEWEIYDVKVSNRELRLSGGDLQEAITLRRVGPATPRAEGVEVPPAPPEG